MEINPALNAVVEPPIAEAQAWIAGRSFPPEKPLLDLAQAVPSYPPAKELRDRLADLVREPGSAFYTGITGLPELREALALSLGRDYQATIQPQDICITAGCNQAYCLTMTALAGAGDEVLLPAPYYFNHHMWLEMQGVLPVLLPFRPESGGLPSVDDAAARITSKTRALLLVSPNNPTGAIYPPELIEAFYALAKDRGLALVVDETYYGFRPTTDPAHNLFSSANWRDHLIHLYSFSKAYSLTGYRIGAIVAGEALLAAVSKAMDCVAICAPRIGQLAALLALTDLDDWREGKRQAMAKRVEILKQACRRNELAYELVSAGAYFAYLRHPFSGEPATHVARRLVDQQNLLALPGSMFGPNQEDFLRLAFANVEDDAIPQVVDRLVASQSPELR